MTEGRKATGEERQLTLRRLRSQDPSCAADTRFVRRLYRRAFPISERVVERMLFAALDKPREQLLMLEAEGRPLGFARLSEGRTEGEDYCYLMYLALEEGERGAGWGTRFLRMLPEWLQEHAESSAPALVLCEAEDPAYLPEDWAREAERRLRFYGRLGWQRLSGIRYLMNEGRGPTLRMHVLCRPLRGPLSPKTVLAAARDRFGKRVAVLEEVSLMDLPD